MDISGVTFRGPKLASRRRFCPTCRKISMRRPLLRKINGFVALERRFSPSRRVRFSTMAFAYRRLAAASNRYIFCFPRFARFGYPFRTATVWAIRPLFCVTLCDRCINRQLRAAPGGVLALSWQQFFTSLLADPFEFLQLHPLIQFQREWRTFAAGAAAVGISRRSLPQRPGVASH